MQSKFADVGRNTRGFAEATDRVGKAAQSAGKGAEKGTVGLGKFASSLMRIAKYRFLRSVLKALTGAFKEGLENVYLYSNGMTGEAHRMAATLDSLATANQTMKNQIGSAWGELLSIIQPVINSIMQAVQRLADWLSQLFAAFGGHGSYYKAVDASAKWAKNTASGAKSAKEMRRQLMGFDEINRLDKPTEPSGGGGGANKKDASKMFEYTAISDRMKKIAETIRMSMPLIEAAAGASLLGLGAILTFSGANIPLGLGLMAAGAVLLGKSVKENWDSVPPKIQYAVSAIMVIVGTALFAIGTIFMLTGHFGIGLGLMIAGMASVGAVAANFNNLTPEVQKAITGLMAIIAVSLVALGVVFLFFGQFGLGLAMILAGGALGITAMSLNEDALPEKVRKIWGKVKTWWDTHVAKYFTREFWQDKVDKMFDVDAHIKMPVIQWSGQPVWDWLAPVMDFFGLPPVIPVPNVVWQSFATGGFPEDGLFMANHGELVGQFSNGNTAVANNEQIIQGIERGVYNAVTSAMANNNGNGNRDIRVFLDGKEIGAATRKYERNMNRATGVAMA